MANSFACFADVMSDVGQCRTQTCIALRGSNIPMKNTFLQKYAKTRMVQLPATTAIEYVAACWMSGAGGIFVRGCFCLGGLLPGGTFGRGLLAGGIFVQGCFCPGGLLPGELLSGGLMPLPPKFNAYTHCLVFLCLAS